MAIFYGILSFFVFIFLSPILIVFGVLFALYRQFVKAYLKHKYGKKFKGLISGGDLLWTVGDDTESSVVNTIMYIELEKSEYDPVTTPQMVLAKARGVYGGNLVKRKEMAPKLFYKRQCAHGYSFWLDEDPGPIDKYIQTLDFETESDFVTHEIIARKFSKYSNRKLPDEHTRNWEYLIGNKVINAGDKVKLPVLYRISHIMGDGVTIMRLILEVMADNPKPYAPEWDFWNAKETSKFIVYLKNFVRYVYIRIILIFVFPYYVFCDLLRSSDVNVLHPEKLSGDKMLYYIHEADVEFPLLETIKRIRRHFPGTRFNDVLLTLAAKGVAKVFGARSQIVPSIQCITAERIVHEGKKLDLHNKFSCLYRTLPMEETLKPDSSDETYNFSTLLKKIRAPVPHLEIMVRDIVTERIKTILPVQILRLLLRDLKTTLAISSLPGLNTQLVIGGYELKDMTFFNPNLCRIAIGIGVLTYGDKVHLSIHVDKATISDEAEMKMILDEMVKTIRSLRDSLKL